MTSIHRLKHSTKKAGYSKKSKKSESNAAPPTRVKLEMSSMLRCADGWLVR